VIVNDQVYIYCVASDPDGDTLSVSITGNSFGHVSGVISSNQYNGEACPSGASCYRGTLWGDNVGTAHIVATVKANGKSDSWSGDVPVKPDQGF
jgi:hypothetical protein